MPKARYLLLATFCFAAGLPELAAANSYDGAYSGKRNLTKGTTPPCVQQEGVTVTITGSILKFTNSELREFALHFEPQSDGKFATTYEDRGGDVVDVRGHANGTVIDADVVNYGNRCEHHWHLERTGG